jgi:bla regulator protein BlaR1
MTITTFADVAAALSRSVELSLIVKATVALTIGIAAVQAASRARSSVRHLILAATLGTLLALPVAMALSPALSIEVPVSRVTPPPARTDGPAGLANPSAVVPGGEQGAVSSDSRSSSTFAAASVLRSVWAIGVILLVSSLGAALWRLGRIVRTSLPWLDAPEFVRLLIAGDRVSLLLHEDIAVPVTCGISRPAILLPSDAPRWTEAELRSALLHELEHVRRADWLVQIAGRITCAVYWFHPLAWITLRKLCLESERACDDAVIPSVERTDYASQLVSLAQRLKSAPASPPLLSMANRSDLSTRVTAVLDASQRRGRAGAPAVSAAIVVAAALVGSIAPIRAVAAVPPVVEEQAGPKRAPRGDRALYRAAERGELQLIAELIDSGANVNAAIDGDGSPLIGAAREGRVDAVRLLLDRGADPNMPVSGDGNPIIMAAREGHLQVVELLLARGASIDQVVDGDENALIQASGSGHLPVVRFLVGKGADVNARVWADQGMGGAKSEWRTPLKMASRGGHETVVAFLRAAGARE